MRIVLWLFGTSAFCIVLRATLIAHVFAAAASRLGVVPSRYDAERLFVELHGLAIATAAGGVLAWWRIIWIHPTPLWQRLLCCLGALLAVIITFACVIEPPIF